MSTSVFTKCDGAVYAVSVQCQDENSSVFKIMYNEGTGGGNKFLSVPISGFALEQQGNYQFLHTVGDFTYFYLFGDRIGELTVSGFGFISPACGPAGGKGSICELYNWYQQNRVAAKNKAMGITLGNNGNCGSFWAFLTGMRMEMPRADILVAQWSLRFNVIPKKTPPINSVDQWRPPSSNYANTYGGGFYDGPVLGGGIQATA